MKPFIKTYISLLVILSPIYLDAQQITFDDSGDEIMTINNGSVYEIGLYKSHGSIAYIRDVATNETLVTGSQNFSFWEIVFKDWPAITSQEFSNSGDKIMSYEWDDTAKFLTLLYENAEASVRISIQATLDSYFDMQMEVDNQWGYPTIEIEFPGKLLLELGDNNTVVLPHLFPGAMFFPEFFKQKEYFLYTYPDVYHADYASINYETSNLSLYSINYDKKLISVEFGLEPNDDIIQGHNYRFKHEYIKWLQPDSIWESPVSRFWIGKSTVETIKSYRTDNQIDNFPSLEEKLGIQFDTLARSPLLCYHYHIFPDPISFKDLPDLLDLYPSPALLMITSYFPGGCHGNYPDYLPPDARFGTAEDLKNAIQEIKAQGKKVQLLTHPVWWNDKSTLVQGMSEEEITDAAVIQMDGSVHRHSFVVNEGAPDEEWDYGWFISPHSPLVKQKLNEMFDIVFNEYGADYIYQDVLGATYDNLDFNANSPSPDDFKQEWQNYAQEYSNYIVGAEFVYDQMVKYMYASYGSNVYSGLPNIPYHNIYEAGKPIWQPFPVAPIMYGDKITTYLWHVGYGIQLVNLSYGLIFGSPLTLYTGNEIIWEEVNNNDVFQLVEFQNHVGPYIFGKQMLDYTGTPGDVTTAEFENISITTNWNNDDSYSVDNHIIPPHGTYMRNKTGALVAGTFTKFNGEDLLVQDENTPEGICQYLIQISSDNTILIKHPKGVATPLTIERPAEWTDDKKIEVSRWTPYDKHLISHQLDQGSIQFEIDIVNFPDTLTWYKVTYGMQLGGETDYEGMGMMQIYPNPAETHVFIKGKISSAETYSLLDLTGREIQTGFFTANQNRINLSGLPPGIYLLKTREQCIKIVKK